MGPPGLPPVDVLGDPRRHCARGVGRDLCQPRLKGHCWLPRSYLHRFRPGVFGRADYLRRRAATNAERSRWLPNGHEPAQLRTTEGAVSVRVPLRPRRYRLSRSLHRNEPSPGDRRSVHSGTQHGGAGNRTACGLSLSVRAAAPRTYPGHGGASAPHSVTPASLRIALTWSERRL